MSLDMDVRGSSGGWWGELDDKVLGCLGSNGCMTPKDLSREVGLSESAIVSILCLLAQDGKIEIRLVAAATETRQARNAA